MPRRKREKPFSYRPTVADRDAIVAAWHASGLSFSAFVSASILKREVRRARRRAAVDERLHTMVLWHASRIGDHVRKVSALLPAGEREAFERAFEPDLLAMRTLMVDALGRER